MQVFAVGELAEYVRIGLERDPALRDLWVAGEVSNLTRSAAGHAYFTLKDAAAALRCVLFRTAGPGAEHLAHGARVAVHGRVSFYTARGDLQIYADAVVPAGAGVLQAEFERLKARLASEGLFAPSRKRPLPAFPRRVGVVTSDTGAVFHDICRVLGERYPLVEVVLCAAQVQGDDAPGQIADALRALNALPDVDVIIAGRGGGSLEDLWAFNTEAVARAIYGSHAPVVSAVGHETDVTIADMVADVRAPTPSAAAAAVAPDQHDLARQLAGLAGRASAQVAYASAERRQTVGLLVGRLRARLPDMAGLRQGVDDWLERGRRTLTAGVSQRREQAQAWKAALAALDPAAVLGRGYAVVTLIADGSAVTSATHVRPGDRVRATVRDGNFDAVVDDAGLVHHGTGAVVDNADAGSGP